MDTYFLSFSYKVLFTIMDKLDDVKERFVSLISSSSKSNSPLLSREQYDEIVNFLKAEDRSSFPRRLKRRVLNNKYQLMKFPSRDIDNILCVPTKNNQVSFKSFCLVPNIENKVKSE